MGIIKDISGQKFGRLTVLYKSTIKSGTSREIKWLCKCDCGNYRLVNGGMLRNANTQSCGCLKIERIKGTNTKHGNSTRTNGQTSEYKAWSSMKDRCYNKNKHCYPDWGGRGIKVCERWLNNFENFLSDMGKKPSNKYSLDRIENSGNYEPTNCRWALKKQQANNTRYNKMVTYNGKTQSLALWCDELNLRYEMIQPRLVKGWTPEQAFTLPKFAVLRFLNKKHERSI